MPPTETRIVGRYAPSPTGALHLGNLRTALAAWASVRSRGGKFLLRIEDIDRSRSRPHFEALQLEDLHQLGIDWDDPPIRQSTRTELYESALVRLRSDGWLYPCFCSRRDLRESASAPHGDEEIPYPGHCRDLAAEEVASLRAAGAQSCERIRVGASPTRYADLFDARAMVDLRTNGGDFVVRRADGGHAYQLACAVDDLEQGVTEVLRGADLLASAQRQIWLMHCLGRRAPSYFHLPLMLGEDGRRLAKREGSDDLKGWLVRGFDATAVRSYLAHTLGMAEPGERVTPQDLPARWDVSKVPQTPVILNVAVMRAFVA